MAKGIGEGWKAIILLPTEEIEAESVKCRKWTERDERTNWREKDSKDK